jgi:hypothetical protein
MGAFIMGRESWEVWHDDWYDRDECVGDYADEYHQDDIEAWKEERDREVEVPHDTPTDS